MTSRRGGEPHSPRMAADVEEPAGEAVRLGPLADYIGYHLRLAQEASFRAFAQRVGDEDLKPQRFAMLTLIRENPGLTQAALGRASGRDKSTVTPALDDLERRGLITRERTARDRRSYAVRLTPEGEAVLAELTRHAAAHDRALDEIVGRENKAEFLNLLRRIAAALG
ncbi:MarR family transcriptional regulator [Chelatococcus sp. SYSU_G07232]|uniref:MarR family transcriptional regulator n=1 Tax=Chelatococcus albus TaxID=3047466 RepID=A0ABT7ACF2_9HYPH|nr:MarR family transcriptional regulator [Chelatococcus sp. SYSU_G07232]MDJ1157050.1 MarR family transcriptional regulator [Chelatococcus sp. SYSU_G07232]